MTYLVAGRILLIEAYDDWSVSAVSQIFARWFLTALPNQSTNESDVTVRIRCGATPPSLPTDLTGFDIGFGGTCHTDNSSYYVKFDRSLIVFTDRTSEVDLWVDHPCDVSSAKVTQLISHALSPALRRCGVFEIHSAGVVPPGHDRAVMFAGPSGSVNRHSPLNWLDPAGVIFRMTFFSCRTAETKSASAPFVAFLLLQARRSRPLSYPK
jgi:hypothetical protein